MQQLQIEPNRHLTPSPKKVNRQDQDTPQQEEQANQLHDIGFNPNQEPKDIPIETDPKEVNLRMMKIPEKIEKRIPDGGNQISQKNMNHQETLKISWRLFLYTIIIILLSSGISAGFCYGMMKYGFITASPIDNSLKNDVLARVSDVAPTENNSQSQTKIPPFLDDGWTYFDQPKLVFSFYFNNINENVFNFTSAVPKEYKAKYIKLIIANHAGWSTDGAYQFWIRTRVINGKKQWAHWSTGWRHKQEAVSFNSEELIVPCQQTQEIRFQTWNTQASGGLLYYIAGYWSGSS